MQSPKLCLMLRLYRHQLQQHSPPEATSFGCCSPRSANAPPAAPTNAAIIARRRVAPVTNDFASESNRWLPILVLLRHRRAHAPKPAHMLAQAGRARSAIAAQATRKHLRAGCIAV